VAAHARIRTQAGFHFGFKSSVTQGAPTVTHRAAEFP